MNQQDQIDRFNRYARERCPELAHLIDGNAQVHLSLLAREWDFFQLADNAALEVIAAKDAEIAALRSKVVSVARDAIGFRYRDAGMGSWSYNYHRSPDAFERGHCEIQWLGVIQEEALLASQEGGSDGN